MQLDAKSISECIEPSQIAKEHVKSGLRLNPTNGHHSLNGRKLRGSYYTPSPVAAFLAAWAIQERNSLVLEPSAGDGRIVAAAVEHLEGDGHIIALELYSDEAENAAIKGGSLATVIVGDFFDWYRANRPDANFDCVIGNPPFIRYQDFPEQYRQTAFELMREEGLRPTRLTNAWLPFVVVATRALRPGGRLALVLPAELLQVGYAAELRAYLARKYSHLTVITFRKLVFDGIQQETVLLLGIRQDSTTAQMHFIELDNVEGLHIERVHGSEPVKVDLDHAREKWTQYYLAPNELALIRELEMSDTFVRLGSLAQVDVGIVTGRNEFFVLTPEETSMLNVQTLCVPLVGRAAQIPGLVLREGDWNRLASENGKCFLFHIGNLERDALPQPALAYIEYGEENGFHSKYKCRIRLPRWWNVPSAWVPDAFLLRQIHDGPRIIQNAASATCTDTIHRVRVVPGIDTAWLAAASINSLTFAFAEIRGRSYGGGVLELEPTEAEALPFPRPSRRSLPLDELDLLARKRGVEHVLVEVDRLVLRSAGLNEADIRSLRHIWRKLYERRISRKRR